MGNEKKMIRNLLDSFSIDNNNDDYGVMRKKDNDDPIALDFMIILFSDQFLVMSELLFNDRKLTITGLSKVYVTEKLFYQ